MPPRTAAPAATKPTREPEPSLSRTLVAAFLDNVPDYVYFKDRESRFIAVSRSLVQYFGCSEASQIIGKSDFDFFDEKDIRPSFEDEAGIMRSGLAMIGKVEKLTWPDGRETWVRTSKLPLRDESGAVIGTFGLSQDITESRRLADELEGAHRNLVDASRLAGMAEVATGVLHNVGNVLNSINVAASVIATGVSSGPAENLAKLSALLREHGDDLGAFLAQDPKGKLVPAYLESLARHATEEKARLLQEIDQLQKGIDHIKEIVGMQQAYATTVGVVEDQDAATLVEDAVRMNSGALLRHDVKVEREFADVPFVRAEKGKVLQILVNFVRNAKYACDDAHQADGREKIITLRIQPGAPGRVLFIVADNGIGIPAENLTRIFAHGFTTRAKGHGFGLHHSAIAAKEMGGSVAAQSDGPGRGAAFTLDLPAAAGAAS